MEQKSLQGNTFKIQDLGLLAAVRGRDGSCEEVALLQLQESA